MQFFGGVYYPEGERHMIDWCEKHGVSMFGRTAYQGKKQLATIDLCTRLGRLQVAVDVGAHIGHWSMNLAKHFGQVLAFEPVQEHRDCFRMNVDALNVTLHDCALGQARGSVRMNVERGNTGNSSIDASGGAVGGDVEMHTLDSFQLTHIDLIKIDTEGFEVQVLRGAEETIKRCRPVIIVEQKRDMGAKYGNRPKEAVDLLRHWGYKVHADMGGDFLMVPA